MAHPDPNVPSTVTATYASPTVAAATAAQDAHAEHASAHRDHLAAHQDANLAENASRTAQTAAMGATDAARNAAVAANTANRNRNLIIGIGTALLLLLCCGGALLYGKSVFWWIFGPPTPSAVNPGTTVTVAPPIVPEGTPPAVPPNLTQPNLPPGWDSFTQDELDQVCATQHPGSSNAIPVPGADQYQSYTLRCNGDTNRRLDLDRACGAGHHSENLYRFYTETPTVKPTDWWGCLPNVAPNAQIPPGSLA